MTHDGGWWFLGMHALWWLFWIGLCGTLFSVVRPVPRNHARSGERAREILQRRYAAGHLSTAAYERRKAMLGRGAPHVSSSGAGKR